MTDPLIVDTYPGDGQMDWPAYIAAGPPWIGAVFKLSEGLKYEYSGWAYTQRQRFLESTRYGIDLFDGFYHYLDIGASGKAQAEWFWSLMRMIGGEQRGTLWGMVDVERGGQRVPLTRARVGDCLGDFAARYETLSGRKATLYGGELLRAIGAQGLYGCGRSSVALYGPQLHGPGETTSQFLARTGTDLAHLFAWQYDGTEDATGPVGYPRTAPGCGERVDISAMVMSGGVQALRLAL